MIVRFVKTVETFADLHRRLGEVPLDRIRLKPAPGTATEEDLLRAPKPLCELIDGVLVEKAMGIKEAILAGVLVRLIGVFADESDLGVVAGADGPYRLQVGLVRLPDVSFIPWSRIPNDELPDDAISKVIPTLAVEVLSKSNTKAEIDRKLRDYFVAGVKLTWVIDPKTLTAKVYTTATRFRELGPDGVLDGGRVLPGFKLALADLFAATKRRKKKSR
jgi:Uma2 family endonuclease